MHYGRCEVCRGEIFRKDKDHEWKHVHIHESDKHQPAYTKGSGLVVERPKD